MIGALVHFNQRKGENQTKNNGKESALIDTKDESVWGKRQNGKKRKNGRGEDSETTLGIRPERVNKKGGKNMEGSRGLSWDCQ